MSDTPLPAAHCLLVSAPYVGKISIRRLTRLGRVNMFFVLTRRHKKRAHPTWFFRAKNSS